MEALRELVRPSSSGSLLIKELSQGDHQKEHLVQLLVQVIRDLLAHAGKAKGPSPDENLKPAGNISFFIDASCLSPRGKFTLSFAQNALLIEGPRNRLQVQWEAIKSVAIIDNVPKDTKGRVLLFLYLGREGAVAYGKQTLDVIVIQTLASEQLDVPTPGGDGRLQGPATVVLCQALGSIIKQPRSLSFSSPTRECFHSSSGALAVDAVVKVNQGHLHPLPDALCFLEKPAMYISLTDVTSIELLRAGEEVGSYFDVLVHLKSGKRQEFSNLAKTEVGPMMQYIAARGLQAGSTGSPAGRAQQQDTDADCSDEDSDFDPDKSEAGEDAHPRATVSGHKRSLANGTQASHADEDEGASEDIEDEEELSGDEGEEGDSDEDEDDGSGAELVSESLGSDDEQGSPADEPVQKRRRH